MFHNLAGLLRYRGLIQSLVARELKARYRGSVLGFFWSFINPLLLLLVYSFVFTVVMPSAHDKRIEPYALFMFCGILPWTWFSSSLNESAGVLISGGNLIKKVLFPAEILPIVTVLANMIHFFFGLVILAGFLVYYQRPQTAGELALFPVVVLVQLILTLGFALLLSALTVHFRDIRDILSNLLTFWFFATPIIYPWFLFEDPENPGHRCLASDAPEVEPLHAPCDLLPGDPVLCGTGRTPEMAASARRDFDGLLPVRILRVRPVARHVRGGSVTKELEPRSKELARAFAESGLSRLTRRERSEAPSGRGGGAPRH